MRRNLHVGLRDGEAHALTSVSTAPVDDPELGDLVQSTSDNDPRFGGAPLLGATLDEVRGALEAFAGEQQYPYFWCSLSLRHAPLVPVQVTLSNFPAEWVNAYRDCRWADVDPVLHAVRSVYSYQGFALEELMCDNSRQPLLRAMLSESRRLGLDRGYCVHRFYSPGEGGYLALAGMPAPGFETERYHLETHSLDFIGKVCHSLRTILGAYVPERRVPALTAVELGALRKSAAGYTLAESAAQLLVSTTAVEKALARARKRLGARSHKEALVMAASLRLIDALVMAEGEGAMPALFDFGV